MKNKLIPSPLILFIDNLLLSLIYKFFKKRTYIIHTNGSKYLLRVYLKHKGIFPEVFLHKFYASDQDRWLHNHPFQWATSFVFMGIYKETKLNDNKLACYDIVRSSPTINRISIKDYHKVTLIKDPIWTLFIAGPRVQGWGFWDIDNQKHIPWQQYVDSHGNFVTDLDGNITKLPAEK